jgi:cellulose synthase/poly-beta-1,6-N-acetylglucosamine synthase-like glycosyltransferase
LWPEYGAYFEDTDLAFRLRRAGYRCIYEPKSRVFHRGSATYGTMPDRLIRLISRNEELVFWINLPTPWLLAGLIPHLAFQCVRMLRKACTGQLGPYLEGKFDAFRLMGRIAQRRRELAAVRPGHAVSLGVQYGLDVVNRGVTWLRHRRAA